MFPQAAQATVTILERLGHQVCFPEGQVCCGQMHANTGYFKQAAKITRNHVETFSPVLDGEWDAIVIPSGSCTGAARHEQGLVAEHVGDTALAKRVEQIAAHTYDLTELLIDVLGTEDVGAYFPHTVTYHPTCHSLRIAKVADRPYRLLKAVEALTHLDARGQGHQRDVHARRGAVRRRLFLPHAHRRWPVPRQLRGAHHAPGRDPGLHQGRALRGQHLLRPQARPAHR